MCVVLKRTVRRISLGYWNSLSTDYATAVNWGANGKSPYDGRKTVLLFPDVLKALRKPSEEDQRLNFLCLLSSSFSSSRFFLSTFIFFCLLSHFLHEISKQRGFARLKWSTAAGKLKKLVSALAREPNISRCCCECDSAEDQVRPQAHRCLRLCCLVYVSLAFLSPRTWHFLSLSAFPSVYSSSPPHHALVQSSLEYFVTS